MKKKVVFPNRVIISRVDSIGDVMLTLPLAGILKEKYPECKILFLGSSYTKDIINCSVYIDEFIDYSGIEKLESKIQVHKLRSFNADTIIHVFPQKKIAKIAKKAKIKNRIGTSHRYYHWLNCNHMVSFSRKRSDLHESQLNVKLLEPLLESLPLYTLTELSKFAGFVKIPELSPVFKNLMDAKKINLILHPKSKGSAREWGLDNFAGLINALPEEDFNIFITGSPKEGEEIEHGLLNKINRRVNNLCGKMELSQLISFIKNSDALVACSTGPLHIASIAGINAIGIYPPIKPMDPGRWGPIGEKTKVFVKKEYCEKCRKTKICKCILNITPCEIAEYCKSLKK